MSCDYRQYIGARYVPTYYKNSQDPTSSEWEPNVIYDPLTIVSLPNMHSYQSKKMVPANIGSPAQNPEYWYDQGYAQAYYQALQDQIDDMKDADVDGSLQNQIISNKDIMNTIFYVLTPDMSQDEIRAACATYDNIYFSNGIYEATINSDETVYINARDNQTFWIDGEIHIKPNDLESGGIFSINNVKNVRMFGHGKLVGDRDTHLDSAGEWQNCINVQGAKNVIISGLTLTKAWGDGIFIGNSAFVPAEDIIIDGVVCDANRRNGISITNAKNVKCFNSRFINSHGTAPQSGIGIETDVDTDVVDNIMFIGCYANTSYGDAAAYVTAHASGSVLFDGCVLESFSTGSGKFAFAATALQTTTTLDAELKSCVLKGRGAIAASINSTSHFTATGCTAKNLATTPLRITHPNAYTTCHNLYVEMAIVDSAIEAAVTPLADTSNCLVNLDFINTTLNVAYTLAPLGTGIILHLNGEKWIKLGDWATINGSANRLYYDDTSGGYHYDWTNCYMTEETEYIIANKSTSSTVTFVGTCPYPLLKNTNENLSLAPNQVARFKLINGLLTTEKFQIYT